VIKKMTKLFEPYAYYLGIDEDIGRLTLGKLMKGYHNIRKLARAMCEKDAEIQKMRAQLREKGERPNIVLKLAKSMDRRDAAIVALRKAVE